MKSLHVLTAGVCLFISSAFAGQSWDQRIYDSRHQEIISKQELVTRVSDADNIVLSEDHHYVAPIHEAQAALIDAINAGNNREFVTGWEFLDFEDQAEIEKLYGRFIAGELDARTFTRALQGDSAGALYNLMWGMARAKFNMALGKMALLQDPAVYAPIWEVAKSKQGSILGTNISRRDRAIVAAKGIAALRPEMLPAEFELGTANYLERFRQAMEPHLPPGKSLDNYYAAQCLSDDWMALQLVGKSGLKFLVVGSFHADFNDGVVHRLKVRARGQNTVSIKIVDASIYAENEMEQVLKDPTYGAVADYVYIINEPQK